MNNFYQKHKKTIFYLTCMIASLSIIVSLVGLLSSTAHGRYSFVSIFGEIVEIYGRGIYFRDSVSVAAQGLASDFITLVIGVPILLVSAFYAYKGSYRFSLILLGTVGYFLYTYTSYVFLWFYNPLFILYVILMSLSFFTLVLLMMSFSLTHIKDHFKSHMPVKLFGIYQVIIGVLIGFLWLGKIAPTITQGGAPEGLEHYTTLVIQGMDLGFVVPVAILSGLLLIKRKPMGYLLTSIVAVKGLTMLLAISAMIINQLLNGVDVHIAELIIFPVFNLFAIYIFVLFMKQVKVKDLQVS